MNHEIRVIRAQGRGFVSSKEVAEKFNREHRNVMRSIRDLGENLSDDVFRANFKPVENCDKIQRGNVQEYLITRDGFLFLAFGFTGPEALQWKEKFVACFNKMEKQIADEIPKLRAEIKRLNSERLALPGAKKPHGNKGMVMVPVPIDTLFGQAIRYQKVKRDDSRFSRVSYLEGELKSMINLVQGMSRKISDLSEQIAIERRR